MSCLDALSNYVLSYIQIPLKEFLGLPFKNPTVYNLQQFFRFFHKPETLRLFNSYQEKLLIFKAFS